MLPHEIITAPFSIWTPPSLKTERKVTFKEVLEWLTKLRWNRTKEFVRTKVELDKEAISKAMRSEPAVAKKFEGRLRVYQADEFFIDTGLRLHSLSRIGRVTIRDTFFPR
jgi:phage host-nuclease inhibitor protein Gam